jgi:phosphatidylglycerophosphatase A
MKEQNNSYKHKLVVAYLSFFYSGFSPKAPGTVGSLATLPLIYLLAIRPIPLSFFITLLIIITLLTCWVTDKTQKSMQVHDPQWIVIDEVLGMLTGWLFIYPLIDWKEILALFIFFRFFDIIKIWPASYFDRIQHGAGTILDDIISGIYAGFAILLGKFFLY